MVRKIQSRQFLGRSAGIRCELVILSGHDRISSKRVPAKDLAQKFHIRSFAGIRTCKKGFSRSGLRLFEGLSSAL
jgi:hypothetical protein